MKYLKWNFPCYLGFYLWSVQGGVEVCESLYRKVKTSTIAADLCRQLPLKSKTSIAPNYHPLKYKKEKRCFP